MAIRPAAAPRKLVVIEEGLIYSMASTERFLSEFPVLRQAQTLIAAPVAPKGGCGGCKGDNLNRRDETIMRVKMGLAGMPDDRRRLLAKMLNTERLRISYRQASRTVTVNFP